MAKQTSKAMASTAAKVMGDKHSSDIQRKLAGSVLAQTGNKKTTSENMETVASQVLQSNKYSDLTKGLAASALSQSTKKAWEK